MRTLTLALLVVSLATLAGLAPGVARANDAGVAASVTKWSVRIGPKAATLGTTMSGTSTTRALAGFRSFTKVARQGAAAISTTKPSTRRGAKLKVLATRAFVNFGNAGALLIRAVQMQRNGKTDAEITATVDQAVALANTGSRQLKSASVLISKIAR